MNDLPRSSHWLNAPEPCAICSKPIRFGDRYSNTDEPALCHESCANRKNCWRDNETHINER